MNPLSLFIPSVQSPDFERDASIADIQSPVYEVFQEMRSSLLLSDELIDIGVNNKATDQKLNSHFGVEFGTPRPNTLKLVDNYVETEPVETPERVISQPATKVVAATKQSAPLDELAIRREAVRLATERMPKATDTEAQKIATIQDLAAKRAMSYEINDHDPYNYIKKREAA